MVTTKDRILELRQQDPEIKAVRIAEQLGITREAIRQQLIELGLPTNFWKSPSICIDCGKPKSSHLAKRCRSCQSKAHHITLACEICQMPYELKLCVFKVRLKRNKHHFCSHRCNGKWLGLKYGFKGRNNARIMAEERT